MNTFILTTTLWGREKSGIICQFQKGNWDTQSLVNVLCVTERQWRAAEGGRRSWGATDARVGEPELEN